MLPVWPYNFVCLGVTVGSCRTVLGQISVLLKVCWNSFSKWIKSYPSAWRVIYACTFYASWFERIFLTCLSIWQIFKPWSWPRSTAEICVVSVWCVRVCMRAWCVCVCVCVCAEISQAMYVWRNIEVLARNYFFCGQAGSTKYHKCVFVICPPTNPHFSAPYCTVICGLSGPNILSRIISQKTPFSGKLF